MFLFRHVSLFCLSLLTLALLRLRLAKVIPMKCAKYLARRF